MIAGEYGGGLNNGGEQIILQRSGAPATVIASFSYDTAKPWPKSADGYGPSLMLAAPATAPDPANPANWTACAQPGGMPGGSVRPLTYAAWKLLVFNATDAANAAVSGPLVDADRDGLKNFAEYCLGCAPGYPDGELATPIAQIENLSGTDYLTFQYRLNAGATEATSNPEISSDLVVWSNGAANIVTMTGPVTNPNGSVSWKVRDLSVPPPSGLRHFHLKMTGP